GTERLKEQIEEHRKNAHDSGEPHHARWLDYLAGSTVLFAILASIASLLAGNYANEALYKANQAVLLQAKAVDTWSEFQADSIKKSQQQTLAIILAHVGGKPAEIAAANAQVARRQKQQDALFTQAQARDAETAALNAESEVQLHHHHRAAIAVTIFQIAIGLAAIAALLGRRPIWIASLAAGLLATLALIDGVTLTV
ncbi:MAG: putative transrane protein, partial [Chloroflexi bacterium]|nr:putative transrane protein [Chloroflexota bacterium]